MRRLTESLAATPTCESPSDNMRTMRLRLATRCSDDEARAHRLSCVRTSGSSWIEVHAATALTSPFILLNA